MRYVAFASYCTVLVSVCIVLYLPRHADFFYGKDDRCWFGSCNSGKSLYFNGGGGTEVYAVSTVLTNEIWFVLGMSICVFNVQLHGKKKLGVLSGLIFVILSILAYVKDVVPGAFTFILGLIACFSVILLVANNTENSTIFGKVMGFLSKYTMPIFLMHTIMAATLRTILLRIDVTNGIVHIVLGLIISFGGPILAAYIMERTTWLEFFLYPNKVLHSRSRIK